MHDGDSDQKVLATISKPEIPICILNIEIAYEVPETQTSLPRLALRRNAINGIGIDAGD